MRHILAIILLICIAPMALAEKFMAPIDNSVWQATKAKRMCQLEHIIPGYGKAIFFQEQGRRQEFVLEPINLYSRHKEVKLSIFSPYWHKNDVNKKLVQLPVKNNKTPVHFTKATSYELADYLHKGLHGKFSFSGKEIDEVIISPHGFTKAYREYTACIDDIIPYTYNQLKHIKVNFVSASMAITEEDKKMLDNVIAQVLNDDDIYKIHITGHSDSLGNYYDNRQLAFERMWRVKDYLVFNGIHPDMITAKGFADRKPIASNKTADGRALNRRAEVRLYK